MSRQRSGLRISALCSKSVHQILQGIGIRFCFIRRHLRVRRCRFCIQRVRAFLVRFDWRGFRFDWRGFRFDCRGFRFCLRKQLIEDVRVNNDRLRLRNWDMQRTVFFRFRPDGKLFGIGVVAPVFYGRQMALLAELNLPDRRWRGKFRGG